MTFATDLSRARVRRITTGHDPSGRAVIVEDKQCVGTGLAEDGERTPATFFQLWASHEMPVSLTDEAMTRQREGSMTTILGTGAGSVLRIGVLVGQHGEEQRGEECGLRAKLDRQILPRDEPRRGERAGRIHVGTTIARYIA